MQASDSFERFDRTQRGPWVLMLHAGAAGTIVPAILFAEEMGYWNFLLYGLVVLFEILAFSFLYLNLRDEGDRLEVRFGPIQMPFCHTTIIYGEITSFEATRSSLMDGWGLHWNPKHGWIYNIWGYDCVKIIRGDKPLRIGTNDPEGLLALLQQKAPGAGAAEDAPAEKQAEDA
ncbi:MAG: hypothetical protein VB817_02115 [Pirellulaceae bacterium]